MNSRKNKTAGELPEVPPSALNPSQHFETAVYLTHTGIINEQGFVMQNTVGVYAYRFICLNIHEKCTIALLCSDSIYIEEVKEFLDFRMAQHDFFSGLQQAPDIELESKLDLSLQEWLFI